MTDRFKFRVWDKNEKTYSAIPYGSYALSDSGELFWVESNCDCSETNTEDYIIEQCTGLKDKNGKLIYEGDIVRYSIGHCGSPRHITGEYTKQVSFYKGSFIPVCNSEIVEIEVIGNIHENEELLK